MKGTIEGLTWETSFTSLSYDCSKCRIGCCRLYEIRLTSNDLKRIADKHASLKKIVDLKDDKTAMKRTKDGCIMLEKNLCRIHDIKPRVCRTFPLFMNPASNGVMKIDCVRLCPEGKEGLKVDEKEVNECVKMLAREYGDYYGMQAKHYRNLTDKLKGRHPLLENLEKIEKTTESALKESLRKEFNLEEVYMQVRKLDGMQASERTEDSSPLDCVQEILKCGVNAVRYTQEGVEEGEIKMIGRNLAAFGKILDYEEVKTPEMNPKERLKILEYLVEVSKRGNASQYVIKSLRDGKKKNVFEIMADYVYYHACTLAVYLNIYKKLEEAIASKEYSFNRRIDTLLS